MNKSIDVVQRQKGKHDHHLKQDQGIIPFGFMAEYIACYAFVIKNIQNVPDGSDSVRIFFKIGIKYLVRLRKRQ